MVPLRCLEEAAVEVAELGPVELWGGSFYNRQFGAAVLHILYASYVVRVWPLQALVLST